MSVSLFAAYNHCNILLFGVALPDGSTDGFSRPDSSYIDEDGINFWDGTAYVNHPGTHLCVEPEEHGEIYCFPEQMIDIDQDGVALVKDVDGHQYAMEFKMSRPMTELEVQVTQIMDLIGAPVTTPL